MSGILAAVAVYQKPAFPLGEEPMPEPGMEVSSDDDEGGETGDLVERLMGKKPELRFQYIQENARFVEELDV